VQAVSYFFTTPEETQQFAAKLAKHLRGGDLLILTGGLGAGKTTFTQGLAEGLQVRGRVSSPTFIIAREHQPLGEGPGLVHVDAYRLGGLAELDALDLDSSLDDVVTVVEWGADLAETLSTDYLEVMIQRPVGGVVVENDHLATSNTKATNREHNLEGTGAQPLGFDHAEADYPEAEPRTITLRGYGPRWVEAAILTDEPWDSVSLSQLLEELQEVYGSPDPKLVEEFKAQLSREP
jgi:tRNA threonylcarbamoyladenosine biosynthesis protein TsaE